jgi:hypothetical protein
MQLQSLRRWLAQVLEALWVLGMELQSFGQEAAQVLAALPLLAAVEVRVSFSADLKFDWVIRREMREENLVASDILRVILAKVYIHGI